MSRSKTRRSGAEYDALERMKHENAKLKRENAKLRRLFQRVDHEKYNSVMEVVQKQRNEDFAMDRKDKRHKIQEKWRCHSCGKGVLKPYVFDIRGALRYYRSCTMCDYRTKMKPMAPGVDLALLEDVKEEEE